MPVEPLDRARQIGMRGALAVDLDLEAVKAGVIHVIRQARAAPQVVEAPAADDAERDRGLLRDPHQQVVALRGQFRRGGVRIEFGQGAVEIKQKNKRGLGRAAFHRGLHVRQHLSSLCWENHPAGE